MSETKVVEGMRCPFCGGVRTESPCEHCNPKVVRYNGIEQDDEGVYVMHSDYARLAAEVETWKRHFDKANAEVEVLVLRLQEAEEEPFLGESPLVVDKLRAERDALAGELEGSKAAEQIMRQEYAKLRDLKDALAERVAELEGQGQRPPETDPRLLSPRHPAAMSAALEHRELHATITRLRSALERIVAGDFGALRPVGTPERDIARQALEVSDE